jgi:hypothetical protein
MTGRAFFAGTEFSWSKSGGNRPFFIKAAPPPYRLAPYEHLVRGSSIDFRCAKPEWFARSWGHPADNGH